MRKQKPKTKEELGTENYELQGNQGAQRKHKVGQCDNKQKKSED